MAMLHDGRKAFTAFSSSAKSRASPLFWVFACPQIVLRALITATAGYGAAANEISIIAAVLRFRGARRRRFRVPPPEPAYCSIQILVALIFWQRRIQVVQNHTWNIDLAIVKQLQRFPRRPNRRMGQSHDEEGRINLSAPSLLCRRPRARMSYR